MESIEPLGKLERLGGAAQYDMCGSCVNPKGDTLAHRQRGEMGKWVYPAAMPDGKHILLMKVLMSNTCENNCLYCVNRSGKDRPVLSFEPEELSSLFMNMFNGNLVQGLFLSSAIYKGVNRTMDRMLRTIEILRCRHRFRGFIHLKILPGADLGHIERAVKLADRVSVNLEAPSGARLKRIAPEKDYTEELLSRIQYLSGLINKANYGRRWGPKGQTTQFVVGAAEEPDTEILAVTKNLYDRLDLSRIYFSAFQPAQDTPLDALRPTPFLREHRIYQVDFLFRRYGFAMEEIGFNGKGLLPLGKDPKMIWAENHPERFPVEVNTAPRRVLLRVPGFGLKTVKRVLEVRREHKINCISQLQMMGAVMKNAQGFILLNGVYPGKPLSSQMEIWEPEKVHFGESTIASPV
ncbi:putative DNA modification/repair radical SAM protein [candidate division WOR-3 bacterium]|uniref:DNA modification/repair radical SAM protein n=1 Tax=candidate division WOR-3 bacterium TaxID=2052148 RepID=A0A9D5QC34_UNCW3|nr:putative DNA modification/repair radical SAM protein [candidate division WOR-3 bacterium]MBD3363627.1 putative DNA modification/repair radical SAM protein [candidate division WOR-3 bacterium]